MAFHSNREVKYRPCDGDGHTSLHTFACNIIYLTERNMWKLSCYFTEKRLSDNLLISFFCKNVTAEIMYTSIYSEYLGQLLIILLSW